METLKEKSIENSRLEEIRDIVAKNRGYENWETLNGSDLYDSDIDEVARMYSESNTAQLKADKEELLSMLERVIKNYNSIVPKTEEEYFIFEIESLIQKHKK